MTAGKKKQPSATMSATDAEAQSLLRLNEWIGQVDAAERMSVGTWFNIPPQFQGWVFMRCGVRGVDAAEALAAHMRRMGYVDAPKGTRAAGFEADGERGLYVMIPPANYKIVKERKEGARRAVASVASSFEKHVGAIGRVGGVSAKARTSSDQIRVDLG